VYLCSLVNYTVRTRKNFIAPDVSTTSDMLQLTVTEAGTANEDLLNGLVSIKPMGEYIIEVYEQTSTTNLDEDNATLLGSDVLIAHQEPTYDAPPVRNAIAEPMGDFNSDFNNDFLI